MQVLESVEASVALAVALVSLAALRRSVPAFVAGLFFASTAAFNWIAYDAAGVYVTDAVSVYFSAAIANLLLLVLMSAMSRHSTESYAIAMCLFLLCVQYVLMGLDEFKFIRVESWLWSWSYEFRAIMDVAIAILGAISVARGNNSSRHHHDRRKMLG